MQRIQSATVSELEGLANNELFVAYLVDLQSRLRLHAHENPATADRQPFNDSEMNVAIKNVLMFPARYVDSDIKIYRDVAEQSAVDRLLTERLRGKKLPWSLSVHVRLPTGRCLAQHPIPKKSLLACNGRVFCILGR